HARRPNILAHEAHAEPPRLLGGLVLRRIERGDAVEPGRADAEELERGRHRVRGELASACTRSGAREALELVQLGGAHPADRVRADRLEDVLDRHVFVAEASGGDRAAVEDETREIEARECHHGGWNRLVAADEAYEAVEQMAARDEL